MTPRTRVALVTLGCGRNEADSEEVAGRLVAAGYRIAADSEHADAVLVNTCGFVASAKKDSIDAILEAGAPGRPVIAIGCLAERYGSELERALPEAAAVLGFDAYPGIADAVGSVLAGERPAAHQARDRRTMLPIAPADRPAAVAAPPRVRLDHGVSAVLRLASGCDRRCAFCAIPRFRGAFVSRPEEHILEEAEALAAQGVRELVCVSENSTSYGKDRADLRGLERLLPQLAAVAGIVRVRVVYLQPAEVRPGLLDVILGTPGVTPMLDLSFQHASGAVLRRMRRFGDGAAFLGLLADARRRDPLLGARTNVILGFPGETRADVAELERFLTQARLDAVGVFPYSDEEDTEAARLPAKIGAATVHRRAARVERLVEQLTAQRAEERIGEPVEVLLERVRGRTGYGRAAHQLQEADGGCTVTGPGLRVGDLVAATVVGADGVDLSARAVTPAG